MLIGRTDAEAETPILGHLMQRADSFEKILMLGKMEGRRRRGRQRMRWLDGIIDSMDMKTLGESEGQGSLACYSPRDRKDLDATEQLNNNISSNGHFNKSYHFLCKAEKLLSVAGI